METVAILGAGAMGSALATPLLQNGHRVHLWGTELDGLLLEAIRARRPHPRTGAVVDARVRPFDAAHLDRALEGATLIVLAVTSTAAAAIFRRALAHAAPRVPVLIVAKGFERAHEGRVEIIPSVLEALAPGRHPFVAVGGPCKANEVAGGWPTVAVFAADDPFLLLRCRRTFATGTYAVATSGDLIGVEVAAATKNAYAIALGACDGMQALDERPRHNLKSALFAQAVAEMRILTEAFGGTAETVFGFAGVGDLEVTSLSGRNRALGERLGRGEQAAIAIDEMESQGQTIEGPVAARLSRELVASLAATGRASERDFPLLTALVTLLDGAAAPAALLPSLLAQLVGPDETRATGAAM